MVAKHAAVHERRRPGRRTVATMGVLVVVLAGAAAIIVVRTSLGAPVASTTTTGPAPTTTSRVAANVTLSAVGDVELGNTPQLPANPGAYLAPIRGALAAPIVFGNLEGTLSNSGADSKCGAGSTNCYAFRVPTSFAGVYRAAGFTVMNSANNHSHDFGEPGVLSTSAALRASGIAQAGLPGQIAVRSDGATKVAFVDFAPYSSTNNLLDVVTAARLIRHAKTLAPLVVVYMHAGAEGTAADHVTRATEYYVGENRGNSYAFAHAAINAGADLVLASGPHVLRGMEWYRGHLINYSLGDFANYYDFGSGSTLGLSAILHVTLASSGAFVSAHFTSVTLSASGQPTVDPRRAAASFVNALSTADFGASAARISPSGAIAPASP